MYGSSSLELVVGVVLLLVVGLVLHDGAHDGHDDDSCHVQVEPISEGGSVSGLELIGKSELVGESASVERDTADEHVGTGEGSHVDKHVLVDEEREHGGDDATTDRDAPEKSLALGLVQNHLVKEDTDEESTPSGKESSTNTLQLHHEEAGDESDQNRAGEHGPANPCLGGVIEERGVEEEQDTEDNEDGSDHEDSGLEKLTTEESKEDSTDDEQGTPKVAIVVKECPESVQVEAGTNLRGGKRSLVVATSATGNKDQVRCGVVVIVSTDKSDGQAASIVRVFVLETESALIIADLVAGS